MPDPRSYDRRDWSNWYARMKIHAQVVPRLVAQLERVASEDRVAADILLKEAHSMLVQLDEDIVAGELLAQLLVTTATAAAVDEMIAEIDGAAQNLLQAIVLASPDVLRRDFLR